MQPCEGMTQEQGQYLQHTLANSFASPPLELILALRHGKPRFSRFLDEDGGGQ